jgi:hypothetical protein
MRSGAETSSRSARLNALVSLPRLWSGPFITLKPQAGIFGICEFLAPTYAPVHREG